MKQHPTFTNYIVTKDGNVINKKTNRILKSYPGTKGYMMVVLYQNKKRHTKSIHRLMMETYDPIENQHLYHAHHENRIRNDNRLENLEWEFIPDHIREHHKGKVLSEETRRKISESGKGRVHSEETRRKMSETRKGVRKSEDHRRRLSETKKGNQWNVGMLFWNNGTRTIRSKECPGEGWVRGRMKRKHNQNKKLINPNKI